MVAQSITLPMDEEGRVTIPAEARRELGIRPGDVVRLVVPARTEDGANHHRAAFLRHAGTLPLATDGVEDEDLDRSIRDEMEEAAIQRYRRSR